MKLFLAFAVIAGLALALVTAALLPVLLGDFMARVMGMGR